MMLITDIKENLVATGNQETGEVESKHGDRGMRVVLNEGQTVTLTRKGTITDVTRKHGNFVVRKSST